MEQVKAITTEQETETAVQYIVVRIGNEILRMLTDGSQTLFCNIFVISLREMESAAKC